MGEEKGVGSREGDVLSTDSQSRAPKLYGAKTLFWYLRLYFTMGIVAFATGSLWYQFINKLVPLEISLYGGARQALNQREAVWAIAALLVIGPAVFASAGVVRRAIRRNEIELGRGVRQWVSYLFLFYVAAIALGDLVTVLRYLISGDYSLRFFLKGSAILVITGWIFAYVWLGLRSKDALATSAIPRVMAIATAVVLVSSIIGGFFIVDSPILARAKAFDRQRVYDLQQVQQAIMNYSRINGALPDTLEALHEAGLAVKRSTEDPKTGEPYEYKIFEDGNYEICADFATDNRDDSGVIPRRSPYGRLFLHGAEHTCFQQSAVSDRRDPLGGQFNRPFPPGD